MPCSNSVKRALYYNFSNGSHCLSSMYASPARLQWSDARIDTDRTDKKILDEGRSVRAVTWLSSVVRMDAYYLMWSNKFIIYRAVTVWIAFKTTTYLSVVTRSYRDDRTETIRPPSRGKVPVVSMYLLPNGRNTVVCKTGLRCRAVAVLSVTYVLIYFIHFIQWSGLVKDWSLHWYYSLRTFFEKKRIGY